jgi:hypothetical protein
LSPAGQSVAFGLDPVNGFCWLGDYEIDIDELLRDRKQPADNQFTKARRMLEISLSSGPVLAVDMEQAAEEQGISHRTLCRAKKALGVVSVKRSGKWYWELSIEVEYSVSADEGCQGCQNPPMEHLALMPVAGEV